MQQPLSTTPPPEPENKCPDCLYMELELLPVSSDEFADDNLAQVNLHLTLQFNEQWEQLPSGRIKFGLKGGELCIKLQNGKIPWTCNKLAGSIVLSPPKEEQEQDGGGSHNEIDASLAENQPVIEGIDSDKKTSGTTDQFPFTSSQVTIKGSQENPAWVFEIETGMPVLKGLLERAKLGTMEVTAKPCCVEATFEVSKQDVHLIEVEGLLPENISRNKRAWIEREIALWLLESKFKPHMSRVELQYD